MKFYKFTFMDGYVCYMSGMDRCEKMHMERKHGKLISKEPA